MQSRAKTVEQYLASLPDDRREALGAVRAVIKKNLGKGYEEGMQYGMIGYYVPHSVYPNGYHCDPKQPLPFAGLASQKNYMSIYLMCVYGDARHEKWFRDAWAKTGKKLDMGKSCVRFKKIEDVPLSVIGQAVKRAPARAYIEQYESTLKATSQRSSGKKSAPKKKVTKKKASTKKATRKKAPAAAKKNRKAATRSAGRRG